MKRRFGILLIEILAFAVLLVVGVLFAASYYIDTDDFRIAFVEVLEEATGRTVFLHGDIDIGLWPDLALEVSGLSISEDPEYGDGAFASLNSVSIDVSIFPLFSNELDVESIVVDGLSGNLIHRGKGQFNWHSILRKGDDASSSVSSDVLNGWSINIHGVEIIDAEVNFKDLPTQEEYQLSGINLNTGEIEPGQDIPFTIFSAFAWVEQGIKSDLTIKGIAAFNEEGSSANLRNASVSVSFSLDSLPKGKNTGEFTSRLEMDWAKGSIALRDFQAQLMGLRAEGDIKSGDLSKDFMASGHVTVHPFSPAELITAFAPDAPVSKVDGLKSSALTSFFDITEQGVKLKDLAVSLDDITVRGHVGLTGYTKPVFDFDLQGNALDIDRYIPVFGVSDTPWIWDDFNLPFFRAAKAKGKARTSGLRLWGIQLSDVRLNLDSTGKSINATATAIRKDISSLKAKAGLTIGNDAKRGVPTLAMFGELDAESVGNGFPFLKQEAFSASGTGRLRLEAQTSRMVCPPEGRSIDILGRLKSTIALSLGSGVLSIPTKGEDAPAQLKYSRATVDLNISPGKGSSAHLWKSLINGSIKTRGGTDIENLTLNMKGPVTMGLDELHFITSGAAFDGHVSSSALPNQAKRVTTRGTVSYDSKAGVAQIKDASIRALETTVSGSARLTGLNGGIKAQGALNIDQADPKRIIFLLADKALRTEDGNALKKVSLSTKYVADEKGFTLSDLKGNLDGMPLKAHVVSSGYKDPSLALSLSAGFFDLDRYLPPSDKPSIEEQRSGKVKKADPVDLPLKFLRSLNINGRATFQAFRLAKIKAFGVNGDVRANKGKIHVSKVKGDLYGGKLNADLKGQVGEKALTTELALKVNNMLAGPFMMDIAKREYFKGLTDVSIDVESKGATDDDIVKYLNGKVTGQVRDGSYKFVGYDAKPLADPKTASPAAQRAAHRSTTRTNFKKASFRFDVKDGVFTATHLNMEAPPVLQSSGKGSFSLPANTINLEIRNDFVAVPSVTIVLFGRLTDPQVKIPTGKIINDTVFNILSLPKKSLDFVKDIIVP